MFKSGNKYILFIMVFFTFFFYSCHNSENEKLNDNLFNKKWIRSHEEDPNDSIQIFRPPTYNFPESPGRIAFRFLKNGNFIYYDIAPGKKRFPVQGRWNYNKKKNYITIKVGVNSPGKSGINVKVIKITDEILKLKKLNKQKTKK